MHKAPDRSAFGFLLGREALDRREPDESPADVSAPISSRIWRRRATNSAAAARPRLRPNALGKQRDHLGVQGVGLGEATERPGAIPDLTRVDDRERQLGAAQRRGDGDLEAADLESRRMI